MNSSKYVCLFFYYVVGLVLVLASTSCQSENKNSVLILAFDHLPSDAVTCADDRRRENFSENFTENSGFAILCKESIRFTHAYTTSLQPAAAMGSLLSGEHPYQNKLHRSFDRISEHAELISKQAHEKNMRTSFFSGGPHILKKTGLSKFFETFDDSSALTEKNYFKDFKTQTENFFEWYHEDPKPFFSVIYNSDLGLSKAEDGNVLEKVDESLALFFKQLKNKNLWDSTTILLVGLNGANKFQRLNETDFQNLHSENTQVATLIKLPRSMGDEGVSWKNDTPLQLTDLSSALKKIILTPTKPVVILPSTASLTPQILIEAPNSWSSDLSWIQFAILQNQDLYIDFNKPVIYNTLTDRMETTNLYKEKKLSFEKAIFNLDELKKTLHLKNAPDEKNKKITSTDRLINTNINLENIWGLSPVNESHF